MGGESVTTLPPWPQNRYLDSYYYLSYPSIDNIVDGLKKLGPGALLYKVDISRAFRHLKIDPGDLDLLGMSPITLMALCVLDLDMGLFSFRNVLMPLGIS